MEEYKYTDIANLIGGGTPKTTEASYWDGNIPWLSVKDFCGDQKYVYTTEKSITEKGLNNSSTKLLEKDDIIISARGTVGEMAMIPFEMAFNQSCFGIRAKKDKVLPDYLYYFTKTKVRELKQSAHGSVFDTITRETFESLTCKLPCLTEQKNIVSILSCLDSKIDLNRRINDNLEQQAQALFKSWFVDFEPFKNGKFVESEIGMIPEGWKVGNLLDVAELSDSKRKPLSAMERSNMNKVYPYYGATSIMDYVDDYLFDGIYLLMGEDGSVMTENGFPYLQYVSGKFWVNNHAHIMQGKNAFTTEMLHCLLFRKNISEFVTGAVQAKISQNNMKRIKLAIAPANVLDSFSKLLDSIYSQIRQKKKESDVLCKKRDLLLPKLMSGKIKINDLNS